MRRTMIAFCTLVIMTGFLVVGMANAKVTKTEKRCSVGEPGLECKQVITDTNYHKDGSGDWLKPNHFFHFRSINGKSCTIRINREESTLVNCKIMYSSVFVSKDGKWSGSGVSIEALGEEAWTYDLVLEFEWR